MAKQNMYSSVGYSWEERERGEIVWGIERVADTTLLFIHATMSMRRDGQIEPQWLDRKEWAEMEEYCGKSTLSWIVL